MKYDAVIFDLDGTLTESEPGIVRSVKYALEEMNLPVPDEATLRRFIGPPLAESFMDISGLPEERAVQAVQVYRRRFETVGWKENSVYPGILRLLRSLKAAGAYIGIATGKPLKATLMILDWFGLAPFIDRVEAVSLTDHHADKPTLVRNALPAHYHNACMVGDRAGDMQGAVANGIDGIGALYGYGSADELNGAGAHYIAQSVSDLTDYLMGSTPLARGAFITFEGADGCGKTTQMRMAQEWLTSCGASLIVSREPGGCPIAEEIRRILLDVSSAGMTAQCEALLYAAARAQHVHDVIRPALERGDIVLCDRYLDSSLAYQGGGRQLGMDLISAINAPAIQGLLPDKVLLYDLSPDKSAKRRLAVREPDRMELQSDLFAQRVYDAFMALPQTDPARYAVIDADRPADEVANDTRLSITQTLSQR